MRITKDVRLSLRMLQHVGEQTIKTNDVAAQMGVEGRKLQLLVWKLKKANLIKTSKGPGGGIYRSRTVSALEVLKALGKAPTAPEGDTLSVELAGRLEEALGGFDVPLPGVKEKRDL